MQKPRRFEVDLIKAVCIVTVVLIHALDGLRGHNATGERFLQEWTRFAVPLFLLTAGFLFNKSNASTRALVRRIAGRILLPYLVCSTLMLWFRATWLFEPRFTTTSPAGIGILFLTGRTLGIYYFVALILFLYAGSLWWRHWPARLLYALWALCGIGSLLTLNGPRLVLTMVVVGMFMYLTGWILSLHYATLRPRLRQQSGALLALSLAVEIAYAVLIIRVPTQSPWYPPLTLAHYYAILLGLAVAGIRWPRDSRSIRFLSEASYAVYLLHFPILRAIQYAYVTGQNADLLRAALVPWILAIGATALLILLLRKIFGRASFYLIGA